MSNDGDYTGVYTDSKTGQAVATDQTDPNSWTNRTQFGGRGNYIGPNGQPTFQTGSDGTVYAVAGQNSADAATQRYQNLGQQWGNVGAPQANYSAANGYMDSAGRYMGLGDQSRQSEQSALGLEQQAAMGNAPSVAQLQMQQGLGDAVRSQMAMSANARGAGAMGAAQYNAAQNAGNMQSQTLMNSGMLRAQEMAQARDAYMQGASGIRAQDYGAAQQQYGAAGMEAGWSQANAQLQEQQNALNEQGQLAYEQLGWNTQNAQMQAQLQEQGIQAGEWAQQGNWDNNSFTNNPMSRITSDIRAKQDIAPAGYGGMQPSMPMGGWAPQMARPPLAQAMQQAPVPASGGMLGMPQQQRPPPMAAPGGGAPPPMLSSGAMPQGAPVQLGPRGPMGGGGPAPAPQAPPAAPGRPPMAAAQPMVARRPPLGALMSDAGTKFAANPQGDTSTDTSQRVSEGLGAASQLTRGNGGNGSGGNSLATMAAVAALFSDENLKTGMRSEADGFLESLRPYSYRYKDPANEPTDEPTGGRYLGVMAQNVEKSPTGQTIVRDTPRGKVLEQGALLSALAAGEGRLHERLRELEREKGKK